MAYRMIPKNHKLFYILGSYGQKRIKILKLFNVFFKCHFFLLNKIFWRLPFHFCQWHPSRNQQFQQNLRQMRPGRSGPLKLPMCASKHSIGYCGELAMPACRWKWCRQGRTKHLANWLEWYWNDEMFKNILKTYVFFKYKTRRKTNPSCFPMCPAATKRPYRKIGTSANVLKSSKITFRL